LADFENGESISQIVTCGHIFKSEPLAQHFRRGERFCPMCRVDVMATTHQNQTAEQRQEPAPQTPQPLQPPQPEGDQQQQNNETTESSSAFTTTMPLSELSQFLNSNPTLQDFSRLFQNAQPADAEAVANSSNLIFQFEIPITSPEID
jgi:uncharacterized Zn finger protein (UPF0148 family)